MQPNHITPMPSDHVLQERAVAVAALTIYDMCKAVDKQMVIGEIRVTEKTKTPLRDDAV